MKIFFFVGLLFILAPAPQAQQLSKEEAQIVKDIEAGLPAALQLLKESVNINSGTFNTAGVRKVGDLFAKELDALGFTILWINMPEKMKRAGHLVAYRKGSKGKKLFLVGHLDTVFEPDMPANPFTKISGTMATGQGINDMKGGDVLIIAALKALHQQGLLADRTITVYLTGDEEKAGEPKASSRGDFIERARQHDIALGFETANGIAQAVTARRGSSEWKLEVKGKQAHSAGIFSAAGYGAVYEASRILNEWRVQFAKEKYLTFNPGFFLGGSEIKFDSAAQSGFAQGKTNIVSPETVVIGDLRFLTNSQKEKMRQRMRQVVAKSLPGTSAKISFKEGIPSMPPTAGNTALLKELSTISKMLKMGEVKANDPGSRGAGDISYVAAYVDCLDGLGAPGTGAHAPGETINLEEYPKLIKRAALLIYRLTR
jgi:glutamate carboxypeptidase